MSQLIEVSIPDIQQITEDEFCNNYIEQCRRIANPVLSKHLYLYPQFSSYDMDTLDDYGVNYWCFGPLQVELSEFLSFYNNWHKLAGIPDGINGFEYNNVMSIFSNEILRIHNELKGWVKRSCMGIQGRLRDYPFFMQSVIEYRLLNIDDSMRLNRYLIEFIKRGLGNKYLVILLEECYRFQMCSFQEQIKNRIIKECGFCQGFKYKFESSYQRHCTGVRHSLSIIRFINIFSDKKLFDDIIKLIYLYL